MTADTPFPDWFDTLPAGWLVLPFSGFVLVILLLAFYLKFIHPWVVRSVQVMGDIFGEEARFGVERKPSIFEQIKDQGEKLAAQSEILIANQETLVTHGEVLKTLTEKIVSVEANVTPNHGSSAHDALVREIRKVGDSLGTMEKSLGLVMDDLEDSKADRKKLWEAVNDIQESK